MKRLFLGLTGTVLAVVAACTDSSSTEPAQESPVTSTPAADAGADAAVAALPANGTLAVSTAEKVAALGQQRVALHATIAGGAGPYRLAWSQSSGPAVALVGATSLDPVFVAPNVTGSTPLGFSLLAVDALGTIVGATTTVTVETNALVTQTAAKLVAYGGQTLTLNAGATGNLDGATYLWRLASGTPAPALAGAATANATVTLPAVTAKTTYTFELVTQNRDGTSTQTVKVEALPTTATADPPSFAVTVGAAEIWANPGAPVALTATTTGAATPTYAWTQVGGTPLVTLANAATANPSFTAPAVTTDTQLVFRVTANDGASTKTSDVTVDVLAPLELALRAAGDQTAAAGATAYLGGAAHGGTAPYRYHWTQTAGTAATLDGADGANPRVLLPYVGTDETLTFGLTVVDGAGASRTAEAKIAVVAPATSAKGPENVGEGFRPLTLAERSVFACTGFDCFTQGAEVVCDERAPFALTTLTTNGTGKIAVTKTCTNATGCLVNWVKNSKVLDLCTSVLPPTSAPASSLASSGDPASCGYCCFGAECNRDLVPAPATVAACAGDVCYPAK